MLKLPKHSFILDLYENGFLCDCKEVDSDWEVINRTSPTADLHLRIREVTKHNKICGAQAKLMELGYSEKEYGEI